MVARVNAPGIGLVANPYPAPKAVTGAYTICEVCNDRKIRTLDWHAHKNSKGHRKNEEAMLGKENQLNTGSDSNGNWAGGETSVVDSGGWGSPAGGFGMEGDSGFSNPRSGNGQGARKFNGACYGCGMEGHSKRDCPTSTRGSGCFNCGETG
jgi:cellular nucleic acid-binding protein